MNKHKETEFFKFHNVNPVDRLVDDSVCRAISAAIEQPWGKTLFELAEMSIMTGYMPTDPKCYERYLQNRGFKKVLCRENQTGEEFCKEWFIKDKAVIVKVGENHLVWVNEGKFHDTEDFTKEIVKYCWIGEKTVW